LNKELLGAIQSEDWSRSQELLEKLLECDPGDRAKYVDLKSKIAQRQASRTMKRVGWAAAAAYLIFIIVQENGTSTQSSDWSFNSASELGTGTPLDSSGGGDVTGEIPTQDEALEEIPPPAGYMGNLSRAQLRYCMFEEARIDVLDREVPPAAYNRFNARVSEFNSRCSGTRYAVSDRTAVESELLAQREKLAEQARAILADWLPAAPVEADIVSGGEQSASSDDENDPMADTGTQSEPSQDWLNSALENGQ